MSIKYSLIIAIQVVQSFFSSRNIITLFAFFNFFLFLILWVGEQQRQNYQKVTDHYSQEIRQRWEANPDKHPHRMAHYGYVAFKNPFALSFFDFGLDAYTGKSIFLEAHKQNTVNFSEAGHSSSLIRFGQISVAMILQLLTPLFLFFLGYDLIAKEREQGILKLIFTQGISWKTLIMGKTLGLFISGLFILLPTSLIGLVLLFFNDVNNDVFLRYLLTIGSYATYFYIISLIAVLVSAQSRTAKTSLLKLLGCWILFMLILPRLAQVIGQNAIPSPSKIEFDSAVTADLIQQGDSHNPNDPHFKALKDSILKVYKVESTKKLPFNYAGLVMKEGEKLSAVTYKKHNNMLIQKYTDQQNFLKFTAFLNPYIAIKNISMALTATDFYSFIDFQNQAEKFRYQLAQNLNELQIKYISNEVKNSADKKAKLSHKIWLKMPDFKHSFASIKSAISSEIISFLALFFWGMILFVPIVNANKWFNKL
jgi:ABC-2 type transport system permease protein